MSKRWFVVHAYSGYEKHVMRALTERVRLAGMEDMFGEILVPTEEVVEITVIAELRRKGFSLQKIRRVLRFLHREMGKRLHEVLESSSELHLVTDGKSIYLEENHERIIDLLKDAKQPMFLVCVTDQVRRLSEPATRKPAARVLETADSGRRARAV